MYSTKEPDFFADMEPTVTSSSQKRENNFSSLPAKPTDKSSPHLDSKESPAVNLSTAMQYQPPDEVCVCMCVCVRTRVRVCVCVRNTDGY